ncbi:unnamed protein product [Gordionus sp. m RMFG-2023]
MKKQGFIVDEMNTAHSSDSHINFFANIEKGDKIENFENAEKEAEKKEEIENWEKKMGILNYLGQSAVDSQKCVPWYLKSKQDKEKSANKDFSRENQEIEDIFAAAKMKKLEEDRQKELKQKTLDYLNNNSTISTDNNAGILINEILDTTPKKSHKHKKGHKRKSTKELMKKSSRKHRDSRSISESSSSDQSCTSLRKKNKSDETSSLDMDKLRRERLKREMDERLKAENYIKAHTMTKMSGSNRDRVELQAETVLAISNDRRANEDTYYNSQFNPDLISNRRKKYK